MKRKEFNDIKGKPIKDLTKMLGEKKLEARKVKMNLLAGKEKNLKVYRNIRREVAQIMTVIREKEIIESLEPKENLEVKTQKAKVQVKIKKEDK